MRTFIICLTYLITVGVNVISSQTDISNTYPKKVDVVSKEMEYVYIHHNTSLLFAGEHLYYNLHVLLASTNVPSTFSKIGYVELVGENGKIVFRHKIRLKNGIGQGEFFVPVTVPSGNYKLIAYTQWMRNLGIDSVFQSDIGIINPFQNNQEAIIVPTPQERDSLHNTDEVKEVEKTDYNGVFAISLDKSVLKKRSQGHLVISAPDNIETIGNFSLSIRKIDSLEQFSALSARDYSKSRSEKNGVVANEKMEQYLPELRGELFSGKIVPKDSNFPVQEEVIALSIPGESFILKLARTNEAGEFYFNLNLDYTGNEGLVQVLGDNRDKYEIQMRELPALDYKKLKFNKLKVTSQMEPLILKRSIYNQVENAFIEAKPDSVEQSQQTTPLYRSFNIFYDLDDYTRFSTLRETTSEVLEHVWVKKNRKGEEVFEIRSEDDKSEIELFPLVLLDGVLVQQHSDIIDFDAKKIKKVNISREEYVVNSIPFRGNMSIESKEADSYKNIRKDYLKTINLHASLPRKRYFNQKYSNNNRELSKQVPDFRQQLLWLPQLTLGGSKTEIDFYTSDVAGRYEISLQGYTAAGTPISLTETFEVK